ncbi:NADPH-dependent oxidoreductase [soil metagenome]
MTAVRDLLDERYGAGAIPATLAALTPAIETMLAHRSVRAYLDKPVGDDLLAAIMAGAQSAASSSNLQAYSVVAVDDAERRKRFAHLVGDQKHVAESPLFLVWLADLSRLERVADQHDTEAVALDYLEMFVIALVDVALAAQNAALAAESLGLGTCYIGGIRNRPEDIAAELRLPPLVMPAFGMCVGWPDEARAGSVRPRLAQPAILHRDVYSSSAEQQPLEQYDGVMAKFYADNKMRGRDWTSMSAKRVSSTEALTGRDRLREALEGFGFKLR